MTNIEYEELLEWRKWEKILLEHPTWSLQIEDATETNPNNL